MLLQGNAVFRAEMPFSFLFFAVDSVLACVCMSVCEAVARAHSARVAAMFEEGK